MNVKLENLVLFLAVVTDLTKTVDSFDSKCPALRLVNGRSRYRWRGRSVRFNCMRGFQLVGVKYATCMNGKWDTKVPICLVEVKYATCMNGKWDTKVPICVRYGCHAPSTSHVNGQFIESYRGAVVRIVCNPGYTLVGSPTVYCNGVRWNETFPMCLVKNTNPALACDFESPDLCGWSQDPMHDFDWRRQNGSTPSGDAGTGPTFDHTYGENNTGHYMYMESSGRMKNDTARLYSPVYPSEYSNGTCFKFWYHMYGATTGLLKVYVKPEGVELFSVIPSFWVSGEQGKTWIETSFLIDPMETPFQIVIEGVLSGSGSVGDTAFDDVKLTSAEECRILEEMTSSTEFSSSVNPDDDSMDYFSCKNRCGQEKTNTTVIDPDNDRCNCYDTCDRDGTCCSDYFDVCSPFPSTAQTTAQTDAVSLSSTSTSPATVPSVQPEPELPSAKVSSPKQPSPEPPSPKPPSPKPPSPKPPSPKPPPSIHYNNESNEIDPRRPPERIPAETNRTINQIPRGDHPTTPRTTTTQPEVQPNGKNSIPDNRKPAKTAKGKTGKPATNKTKVQMTENELPVEKTKARDWNEGKKVERLPDAGKNTTVTSQVSTTTARVFRNPKPNNIQFQKTFLEKPSNTNEVRLGNGKSKEASGKELPQAIKIDKAQEPGGGALRGAVELGSAGLAVLVLVVLGVYLYRRREHRKAERENMVEDSDVRFLTSDEALDFTLARPADDDL